MTTDPFEQLLGLRSAPVDSSASDSATADTAAADRAGSTLSPEPPDREFVHQLRSQLHDALGLSSSERRRGNIFYFTLPAPDPERSRRFWSNVLGWELEESPGGFNIESTTQPGGLSGGTPEGGPTVWLRVVDIHEAARAVVALGGRAGTPVQYPTGWSLDCVAPGGARFNLSVPADAYDHDPAYGRSHGDLFYVSLPAPDADTSM